MSKLATRKRNNKNLSRFQKMWQRVERLKSDISRRYHEIDALAARLSSEVLPIEQEAAKANIDVVLRLLDLGQRKSWAVWQRQEIEHWIHSSLHDIATADLLDDELRNEVARYDAFRMGVELDENDGRSPGEQLEALMKEQQQYDADLKSRAAAEAKAQFENERAQMVEDALDKQLGPRPLATDKLSYDLSADKHAAVIRLLQQNYDQEREKLREELTQELQKSFEEMLAAMTGEHPDDEDDDFNFSFDFDPEELEEPFENTDTTFKLDNATVQRMFRSAAAVLHPDKEPDPEKRLAKQALMVQLLEARKSGDIMALLSLYQEHVENGQALSKADEKQLVGALEKQVAKLERELDDYTPTSQAHETAYELYSPHKKLIDKNIAGYLEDLRRHKEHMLACAADMRSMKTLKPMLEKRYQIRREVARKMHHEAIFSDIGDWD